MRLNNFLITLIIFFSLSVGKKTTSDFTLTGKNILLSINQKDLGEYKDDYLKLTDNAASTNDIGFPELPTYSTLYLVESDKDYEFEIIINESYTLENVNIYPYQGDTDNSENFIVDEDFYNGNQNYPFSNISVSERMHARNMELVSLTITPYSYNPNTKNLEVYTNVQISVNEINSDVERSENTIKRSRLFEQLYADMIINFETSSRQEDYQHPAILYICGGDSCENSYVQQLFEWRHQQGYIVYTATESEVGGNNASTSEIKNYIEDAVENWDNPPEMVGLIGDTEGSYGLPCNYHDWGGGWYGYNGASDFDYTQLNGSDLLSDVLIGRISASSSSDLANIINKTIQYEKALYQSSDWFEGAALVGDPSSSGVSTIITNQYIENMMENFGFENVDTNYGDGNYDNWVEDRFDEGVLYYNYRGFYGSSGIGTGGFSNGFETPFVTSLTCGTGNFDGTSESESFVRTGSLSNPSGAVAAVGVATSGTHTAYNNIVNMGLYEGIFSNGLEHASAAMTSGHLAIYNTYPSNPGDATDTFISWTNLIGDPALHLWTDTPSNFSVSYPLSIDQGTTYMNLVIEDDNGNPVDKAIVTILQGDDDIFLSKMTGPDGIISFNWDNFNSDDDIKLTVRKKNYRPFQRDIDVSSNGSLLSSVSSSLSVNGDGEANPGEVIQLTIPIRNYDNSTAQNVVGTLTSNSDLVNISQSTVNYGNINSNQTDNGSSQYTLFIDSEAIHMENLFLQLNISSNNSDIACFVPLDVYAPLIEPISSAVNLAQETITVAVLNNGSLEAQNLTYILGSNSDMLSITSANESSNNMSPGSYDNLTFSFSPTPLFVPGSVISLPLTIASSDGYNRQEFINATFGEVSVSDPLGPDEHGYFIYDSGDTDYDLAPTYDWIEIAEGLGDNLDLDDDGDGNGSNRTALMSLPFNFTFYGVTYNEITISADGWISFGRNDMPSFRNTPIPGAGGPSPMIAAFWDDLKTGSGGDVYTYTTDEYVIIQWDYMRTYYNNNRETFEIILYNNEALGEPTLTGDNEIKIQYYDFNNTSSGNYPNGGTPTHGCYSTIGIENEFGNQGLQYTFNNQYPIASMPLSDGDALFITTGRALFTAGDINQDNTINVLDVVTLVNIVLNVVEPTTLQALASDVNNDGQLNVLDVVLIVNLVLDN